MSAVISIEHFPGCGLSLSWTALFVIAAVRSKCTPLDGIAQGGPDASRMGREGVRIAAASLIFAESQRHHCALPVISNGHERFRIGDIGTDLALSENPSCFDATRRAS